MSNLSRDLPILRAWRMAFSGPVEIWYFSIFYLSFVTGFVLPVWSVLLLVVALMLYEAWGVLLNDFFDREIDSFAQKSGRERGHTLAPSTMIVLILLVAFVDWTIILSLGWSVYFDAVWVLAYAIGTAYSAPPIRLKNRGYLSLVSNSILERPIPVMLVFTFYRYYGWEILLFPVLSELVSSVFKHQVHDYAADLNAKVRTLAVGLGKNLSYAIVSKVMNPLSIASTLIFGLLAYTVVSELRLFILASVALTVVGTSSLVILQRREVFYSDPLDPPYILYVEFAFVAILLPIFAGAVVLQEPSYIPLAFLFVLSLLPRLRLYLPLVSKGVTKGTKRLRFEGSNFRPLQLFINKEYLCKVSSRPQGLKLTGQSVHYRLREACLGQLQLNVS